MIPDPARHRLRETAFTAALCWLLCGCAAKPPPPLPPRYPLPSFEAVIKEESEYTSATLAPRRSSIEKIFWELEQKDKRDTAPVSFAVGDSCYDIEMPERAVVPKIYKKSCGGADRVLFVDFPALCSLLWPGLNEPISAVRIRPDGAGIAFISGGKLVALDTDTHRVHMYPAAAPQEFEWFNDSAHLLIVTNLPGKSVLAETDLESDIVIDSIEDGRSYFHIERAASGNFLLLDRKSPDSDLWTALDVQTPQVQSVVLEPSPGGEPLAVCDSGDHWIWAKSGAVSSVPNRSSAGEKNYPLPKGFEIAGLRCFMGKAAVEIQDGWHQRLFVVDPHAGSAKEVPADESWVSVRGLPPFRSESLTVMREGLAEPPVRCSIALDAPEHGLTGCSGAPTPSLTETRITAKSRDGFAVPITVLADPARKDKANSPLLLEVYGAYGVSPSLGFNPVGVELAGRGFAVAFAAIRGGGPGLARHRSGMGPGKARAIEDVEAVAEQLSKSGLGSPKAVFGRARSAGAAILLAAARRKPDLFAGLILDAPLLRPRTVIESPAEPFPAREAAEWGDPNDPAGAAILKELDGLESAKSGPLPPIFLSFSPRDAAVPLGDILKFAALRRAAAGSNLLLLYPRGASSHAGEDFHEGEHRLDAEQIGFLELIAKSIPR